MSKAGYSCWSGSVAASTSGLKSALSVIAPAQFGTDLMKARIGFDGVTAANAPINIQLAVFTTDGTGTTNTNVQQAYGRAITAGFTSKTAYTVEPTGLTVLADGLLTPNGGVLWYDFPLATSPDSPVSGGFSIRALAGTAVNVRAEMWFERC